MSGLQGVSEQEGEKSMIVDILVLRKEIES